MVTYFVDKKVTGYEKQQQQQHLKIDKAFSNGKCSSSQQTREDSNLGRSKIRKPSEPECGVRVTITSDTEQQQHQQQQNVRRKSLDPTC